SPGRGDHRPGPGQLPGAADGPGGAGDPGSGRGGAVTGLLTALREGVLVCDGAMGTMLHAAGNSLDRALPELNLSNAELVSTGHESYLSAGEDIIQRNTVGAQPRRRAQHRSAGPERERSCCGGRSAR